MATLIPSASYAQTQDLFVSTSTGNTNSAISRFAGTGLGTFSTTSSTFSDASLNSPSGLAFDSRGDLFVANDNNANTITEFTAGTTPGTFGATTTISDPSLNQPLGLAVDAYGDLFAANAFGGTVTEFKAGTTPGTFGTITTLSGAIPFNPHGLAFDVRGDLFVSNDDNGGTGQGSITEFAAGAAPGTFGATTTFTDPSLSGPEGLAFDARGDLFAANFFTAAITEFAAGATPGTFGTTSTLSGGGLRSPFGLAVDVRGDLFAANINGQSITEFMAGTTPGTFGEGTTFATVNDPAFLAFGPSAPPAVPEASTTVSLGLLLALGIGGMVIAKKRRAA